MTKNEELTRLLATEYDKLKDRLITSDEQLDSAKVMYMGQLIELQKMIKPQKKISKTVYLALLSLSFLICGILVVFNVKDMYVDFEVDVSGFTFITSNELQVTKNIPSERLIVGGNSGLTLPRIKDNNYKMTLFDTPLNISSQQEGNFKGKLSLCALSPPSGTKISSELEDASQFVLVVQPGIHSFENILKADIALTGAIQIVGTMHGEQGVTKREFDFGRTKNANLKASKGGALVFTIVNTKGDQDIFLPEIEVSQLIFRKMDTHIKNGETDNKEVSTLISGRYKTEFMDKPQPLGKNEWLTFEAASGTIQVERNKALSYKIKFYGLVEGMCIGNGDNRVSKMPSYLEWLHKKNEVSLLWGAAIWVFTFLLGGIKWLRN